MRIDLFTRARLIGLGMLAVAFVLGVVTGRTVGRAAPAGVTMMVTATDAVPRELESLGLSDDQRRQVQQILRAGRPRVMQVLDEMQPRMQAAIDVTEDEIARVLTPDQAARWREHRDRNPPRFERRIHGR